VNLTSSIFASCKSYLNVAHVKYKKVAGKKKTIILCVLFLAGNSSSLRLEMGLLMSFRCISRTLLNTLAFDIITDRYYLNDLFHRNQYIPAYLTIRDAF